jgi:RIO kinase 1
MSGKNNFDEIIQAYAKKAWDLDNFIEIKSGKDASVYKVEANSEWVALKIYHNEKSHSNSYYLNYTNIKKFPTSIQRAVKSGNKVGKEMLQKARIYQEFKMLKTFYDQEVSIPKPIDSAANTVLMELIGNQDSVAPQLDKIKLSQDQAQQALDDVLDSMETMLEMDIVHGDLSAYNILWNNSKVYIIDFPQAINIREHDNPREIFVRDLKNICDYFNKYLDIDFEEILEDFESYFEFI